MKKLHSYLIIVSTLLIVSLTVGVSWFKDIESRRVEGERFLFPDLGVPTEETALEMLNDIVELKIESNKGNFSIIREDENWILPALANFPVSVDKVKRVIVGLSQLETIEPKTKNPELHGELGLNSPKSNVSSSTSISLLGNSSNILASLFVGNDSKSGKDTRYVRRPDENQTWLAWRNFELPDNPMGWLEEDLFSIGRWRVADIRIIHPKNPEVFITRANFAEQIFKLENLKEDELPINPYIGNQIGSAIEKLPLKNIKYKKNIQNEDIIKTTYTTFDGLKISIDNIKIKNEDWVKLEAIYDENLRRELPEGGPTIVGLPEMHSKEKVKEEVEALNKIFSKWIFQFNAMKHDQFITELKDIIKKKDLE